MMKRGASDKASDGSNEFLRANLHEVLGLKRPLIMYRIRNQITLGNRQPNSVPSEPGALRVFI